jgi:hypothetical protein
MMIFKVEFEPLYPVGCCLVIAALNIEQAKEIAGKTIKHTNIFQVQEVDISAPCVIAYDSGDY